MNKITTWEEFSSIDTTNPFFFLKNSTTCPISGSAYEEVQKFSEDHPDFPIYYLNVQEARDLSNQIAEHYQIKHESPQLLLIEDGKVSFHDSHWSITYDSLMKASKEEH